MSNLTASSFNVFIFRQPTAKQSVPPPALMNTFIDMQACLRRRGAPSATYGAVIHNTWKSSHLIHSEKVFAKAENPGNCLMKIN